MMNSLKITIDFATTNNFRFFFFLPLHASFFLPIKHGLMSFNFYRLCLWLRCRINKCITMEMDECDHLLKWTTELLSVQLPAILWQYYVCYSCVCYHHWFKTMLSLLIKIWFKIWEGYSKGINNHLSNDRNLHVDFNLSEVS